MPRDVDVRRCCTMAFSGNWWESVTPQTQVWVWIRYGFELGMGPLLTSMRMREWPDDDPFYEKMKYDFTMVQMLNPVNTSKVGETSLSTGDLESRLSLSHNLGQKEQSPSVSWSSPINKYTKIKHIMNIHNCHDPFKTHFFQLTLRGNHLLRPHRAPRLPISMKRPPGFSNARDRPM